MFKIILSSTSKIYSITTKSRSGVCNMSGVPQNPKVTTLYNGVRVATKATGTPVAAVSLFIEAGPRFETPCNNGITHFIERMAYKGFNSFSERQLEESLLCMGAKLTAYTSRELQVFSGTCLTEHVPTLVDIFSHIIRDLALNDRSLETEKQNMRLQLLDADRNPRLVCFDYLHQTAFQGTPLAQCVIGTSQNIEGFTTECTQSFLCKHYLPHRLVLAGVGNIPHEVMVGYAQCKLGRMISEPVCESDESPCRFTGSQISFRDDSMPFAHIAIAFEVPGYGHPDYITLMAAKHLMGTWNKGQGGKMNAGLPLAQAASTSELCEYFESFYIAYRDIGLWGMYVVASRLDVDDIVFNVQDQWMKMCLLTQDSDCERAVNSLKFHCAKNNDGNIRSCHNIGLQTMYASDTKSCQQSSYDELYRVNSKNLKSTMQKYIYDRCPAVAAVGPVEGLAEYTRLRAGTYWLRL